MILFPRRLLHLVNTRLHWIVGDIIYQETHMKVTNNTFYITCYCEKNNNLSHNINVKNISLMRFELKTLGLQGKSQELNHFHTAHIDFDNNIKSFF